MEHMDVPSQSKTYIVTDYPTLIERIEPNAGDVAVAPVSDPVNNPAHYTYGTIECIDFLDSCGYGLDFCLANAIKYLTRCKHKGTMVQDIRKAIWYANHAVEKLESGDYACERDYEHK